MGSLQTETQLKMVLRVFAVGKNSGRRSKCQKGSLVVVRDTGKRRIRH